MLVKQTNRRQPNEWPEADAKDRTISDLVNEAVRLRLAEDAEDLLAFQERGPEPNLSLEKVLKDLKLKS
ncbi:hypothetical protein DSTSK_32590 [Desulforhabdus sp. TSK]|nr:hypothetical protein DSTSK_32590 [Desulforhabdus sp. TSK]